MYLTYDEYSDMGGTLSDLDFKYMAYEAESYIDWYTFDRLKKMSEVPQEVKDCEFYLIHLIELKLNALGIATFDSSSGNSGVNTQIASQSNDGVSVSYNSLAARDAIKSISDEIGDAIKKQLRTVVDELGRKVLYRGLYPNE